MKGRILSFFPSLFCPSFLQRSALNKRHSRHDLQTQHDGRKTTARNF